MVMAPRLGNTISPRINVHALIFEDALFQKQVHVLIFKHQKMLSRGHQDITMTSQHWVSVRVV